jgi:hypothetical protein
VIDDDRVPSHPTYTLCKRPLLYTILADFEFDLRHWGGLGLRAYRRDREAAGKIEVPLADVPQKSPR